MKKSTEFQAVLTINSKQESVLVNRTNSCLRKPLFLLNGFIYISELYYSGVSIAPLIPCCLYYIE